MYGEKDEINAYGCQANGIGMGGLGDGLSQAEGCIVMAWTVLSVCSC